MRATEVLLRAEQERLGNLNPLRMIRHPRVGWMPLHLFPKQREFVDLYHRVGKIAGWDGPNRAGKSLAATCLVVESLTGIPISQWPDLPYRLTPAMLGPPRYWGCVTISHDKSRDGQQKYLAERIQRVLQKGKPYHDKTGFHRNKLVLVNGSTVDFLSDVQRGQSFESFAWHGCWIDEAIEEWVYHRVIARLIDTGGKLMITSVAEAPWIYRLLRQRLMTRDSLDPAPVDLVDTIGNSTIFDNELLDRKDIESSIELWGGVNSRDAQMRALGRYVHLEGVVFPEYDDILNVEEPLPMIGKGWQIFEGYDPGYRNPFAVGIFAMDEAGVLHWLDEIYERGRRTPEIAKLVKEKRARWGYAEPTWAVIDASSNAAHFRGHDVPSYRKELADCGIVTIPADNSPGSKDAGEQRLRQWVKTRRLKVSSKCRWARWEFANYRYDDPDGRTEEFGGDRERRIDAHNHLIDQCRYVIQREPRPAVPTADAPPVGSVAWDILQAERKSARDRQRSW